MPVSGSEDFDRSFEFFAKQHDGDLFDSCVDDFADNGKGKRSLNSTFDTAAFEFSVENSSFLLDLPDVSNSSVARFASFNNPVEFNEIIPVVNILIQEQVSAVYDDFSQEGSVAVSGSILVRSDDAKRFSLVVNDAEHSIQRVEALGANEHVQDVTGGRELLVNLEDCKGSEDVSIANYFCVPKLRPVPLVRLCIAVQIVSLDTGILLTKEFSSVSGLLVSEKSSELS